MKPIDYIIIITALAIVVGVIIKSIRDKKNGKTGCGCDCNVCDGCPSKGACGGSTTYEKKSETDSLK